MKQCINPKPFSQILAQPVPLDEPWSGLVHGVTVAVPAARRTGEAKLSSAAVRVIAGLLEGTSAARYVARSDPALVVDVTGPAGIDSFVYRSRSNQVYGTPTLAQHPDSASLFATFLLLSRAPDFSAAYGRLSSAFEVDAPQAELNALMATTADELVYACTTDFDLDELMGDTVWFYAIGPSSREMLEELDEAGLDLSPLLQDPDMLSSYLYFPNTPTPFDGLKLPALPGSRK